MQMMQKRRLASITNICERKKIIHLDPCFDGWEMNIHLDPGFDLVDKIHPYCDS